MELTALDRCRGRVWGRKGGGAKTEGVRWKMTKVIRRIARENTLLKGLHGNFMVTENQPDLVHYDDDRRN